ncbi:MAG: hypothetical protein WCL05_01590 [Verrucomicrobiota bacterium]
MYALLASLIFVAAGEVAPPPPPAIPDAEVVRYLKPNELIEWNSAMRISAAGESRTRTGQSILKTSGAAVPDSKGPKIGGLTETPEQAKARAQKMIDEGNMQIQQALPVLTRLRTAAAARVAEKTKPVSFSVEVAPAAWNLAVAQSVVRIQKQARDLGYAKTHFIGSISLLGDGKLNRPEGLTADIRAAWSKVDDKSLAAIPAEGYSYVPGSEKGAPSLSKGLAAPTAPKQVAVVWAEFYAAPVAGARGLLFLRLADAHSMRLVASEVAFTELGSASVPVGTLQISLRDDRSFLPRLSEGGDWVLGFDRASDPIGSALLAHLSVTQSKVGVAAAPYVVIVAGGGPASSEGVRAKWRAITIPATVPAGSLAFQVTSIPTSGESVAVGQLTLKVLPPAATK